MGQGACHVRQMGQHVPTDLRGKETSISPEETTNRKHGLVWLEGSERSMREAGPAG